MNHTKKLVTARDQIIKHAKRTRHEAEGHGTEGSSTLPNASRMLIIHHMESVAEGLELAAKIVEKLIRD